MGNKIVTEADRKATPRPALPIGVTRSKKNPGKRARQG
jgi:hypothetical protein